MERRPCGPALCTLGVLSFVHYALGQPQLVIETKTAASEELAAYFSPRDFAALCGVLAWVETGHRVKWVPGENGDVRARLGFATESLEALTVSCEFTDPSGTPLKAYQAFELTIPKYADYTALIDGEVEVARSFVSSLMAAGMPRKLTDAQDVAMAQKLVSEAEAELARWQFGAALRATAKLTTALGADPRNGRAWSALAHAHMCLHFYHGCFETSVLRAMRHRLKLASQVCVALDRTAPDERLARAFHLLSIDHLNAAHDELLALSRSPNPPAAAPVYGAYITRDERALREALDRAPESQETNYLLRRLLLGARKGKERDKLIVHALTNDSRLAGSAYVQDLGALVSDRETEAILIAALFLSEATTQILWHLHQHGTGRRAMQRVTAKLRDVAGQKGGLIGAVKAIARSRSAGLMQQLSARIQSKVQPQVVEDGLWAALEGENPSGMCQNMFDGVMSGCAGFWASDTIYEALRAYTAAARSGEAQSLAERPVGFPESLGMPTSDVIAYCDNVLVMVYTRIADSVHYLSIEDVSLRAFRKTAWCFSEEPYFVARHAGYNANFKNVDTAIQLYEKAHKLCPANPWPELWASHTRWSKDTMEGHRCRELCVTAVRRRPRDVALAGWVADLASRTGSLFEAELVERLARRALAVNQFDMAANQTLAQVLKSRGKIGEAARLYDRLAALFPNDASTRRRVASFFKKAKDYETADTIHREMIAAESTNHRSYWYVAWLHKSRGELDQAIAVHEQYLETQPSDLTYWTTHEKIGWLYYRKGDLANAEKYLAKAASSWKYSCMLKLAQFYEQIDRPDDALVWLQRLVERYGAGVKAHRELAWFYERTCRRQDATATVQKALKRLKGNTFWLQGDLFVFQALVGNWDEAQRVIDDMNVYERRPGVWQFMLGELLRYGMVRGLPSVLVKATCGNEPELCKLKMLHRVCAAHGDYDWALAKLSAILREQKSATGVSGIEDYENRYIAKLGGSLSYAGPRRGHEPDMRDLSAQATPPVRLAPDLEHAETEEKQQRKWLVNAAAGLILLAIVLKALKLLARLGERREAK